jgi:hypothetical protein
MFLYTVTAKRGNRKSVIGTYLTKRYAEKKAQQHKEQNPGYQVFMRVTQRQFQTEYTDTWRYTYKFVK